MFECFENQRFTHPMAFVFEMSDDAQAAEAKLEYKSRVSVH